MVFFFIKRFYPHILNSIYKINFTTLFKKFIYLLKKTNYYNYYIKLIFLINSTFKRFLKKTNNILILSIKNLEYTLICFNEIKLKFNKNFFTFKLWLKYIFQLETKFLKRIGNTITLNLIFIRIIFKKFYFYKLFNIYLNYYIYLLHKKVECLKFYKISNIQLFYEVNKYKDNFKFYKLITPINLLKTITRRYKKGFL